MLGLKLLFLFLLFFSHVLNVVQAFLIFAVRGGFRLYFDVFQVLIWWRFLTWCCLVGFIRWLLGFRLILVWILQIFICLMRFLLIIFVLFLFLTADSLLNHFDNNLIHFDDFFSIKFLKAKLHTLIKDLRFNKVNDMIPLIFFIGEFLNLDKERFRFWNE